MSEMDAALSRGDYLAASEAARRASDCEREALETIPLHRWRTRAIIAESMGSLEACASAYRTRALA
jgi:hypothetical protein